MYTTREEIREEKKWAPTGGGMVSRAELCREASPAAEGGRAGKKGGKRAKSVYVLYVYFFLFFLCIFTNTKKDGSFVHIFMYTQKRKKCICKIAYHKQS